VKPEDVDQLLRAWAADAAYFKQQPGIVTKSFSQELNEISTF
jgi:hypothetical protein